MRLAGLVVVLAAATGLGAEVPRIGADWKNVVAMSRTRATFQVVVQPPLDRASPIHDEAFRSIADLRAEFVRFVPWVPYTRYAVAELKPPTQGKTKWDFALIDPIVEDFMKAQDSRSVVMNFSTIPQWMFVTPEPVKVPDDPKSQGNQLRDATGKEVGEYFARVLSWYTKGGFTDEAGNHHESPHHYKFDTWEVLNEPDLEHGLSPQQYTTIYDAMVTAMKPVAPEMKFMGVSLAFPSGNPKFFEYFLDHKNHKQGVPIDYISYHFYATPVGNQPFESQPYTYFVQADGFLATARYIQAIRERLSPQTQTAVNEVGSILYGADFIDIPRAYWNLSASLYAYLYCELSKLGVEYVGESQLLGSPGQYPSVSMIDWKTGKPNARWRVLKLIIDHLGPDHQIVATSSPYGGDVYAQAFICPKGIRKILLINKRDQPMTVRLPNEFRTAVGEIVDQTTAGNPAATTKPSSDQTITLGGFAVAIFTEQPES